MKKTVIEIGKLLGASKRKITEQQYETTMERAFEKIARKALNPI